MPSAAELTVSARYCLGIAKMALAATEATTAGSEVFRKKSAFLRESEMRTGSKRWQCGRSKAKSTTAAATSMAIIAASRLRVAQ